ncbi:DUF983 domain-containing protein [Halovulum sp. GXIMD14794]
MSDLGVEGRSAKVAVWNGLREKCPSCGKGPLFNRYLKVVDTCGHCGTELHHHRADDGPAYLTILVVGHIFGFALPVVFEYMRDDPVTVAVLLCAVATALSLWLLPRLKGLVVGYQWAKRMHGFDGAPAPVPAPLD